MTTLDDLVRWFESLTRETVGEIGRYYTPDAYFKDPFNEVRGVEAIRRIYAHMFDQVGDPRFRITARFAGEDGAMITWDFLFRMKGRSADETIRGASHLRFAPDGRIAWHRDYWDTAEELYQKLPVLGGFMRFLQRQSRA